MKFFNILFVTIILSNVAHAQIDTSEQNISDAKVIIKDIEKENYFKQGALDARFGLMQLSANKPVSPIALNSSDQLPFIQIDGEFKVWKKWRLAIDLQHAQNLMGTAGGPNSTSSFQEVYQLGVLYKYVLDETAIKNYVSFKLQYYGMRNNFQLVNSQLFYAKTESGILLGVERSVPATELIDLRGGFDLIMINNIASDSILEHDSKGNGLQFKADVLYNLSKTQRVGISYMISAFFNKYTEPGFEDRDRHNQTYKAVSLDYSYLY